MAVLTNPTKRHWFTSPEHYIDTPTIKVIGYSRCNKTWQQRRALGITRLRFINPHDIAHKWTNKMTICRNTPSICEIVRATALFFAIHIMICLIIVIAIFYMINTLITFDIVVIIVIIVVFCLWKGIFLTPDRRVTLSRDWKRKRRFVHWTRETLTLDPFATILREESIFVRTRRIWSNASSYMS